MSRRALPHLLSTALFAMSLPLWFGALLLLLLSTSSTTTVHAALPNTPIVLWTYTIYYTSGPDGTNPNVTQMFLDKYGYNRTQVLDEYRFKFSTLGDIMANMSLAAVSPVSGGSRSPPPPPDVILGIDMLQMYKPNITFKPFTLTDAADLLPNVDRNGPANNVVPADLGSINIVYDELDFPYITKVANMFSYEKLVESCLIDELIVIEPSEATGEHFLMATIALYGDPDRGLNGLYPASYGGWKGWWRRAFQSGMYVAEDWDAAFYPFSDDSTPYAMMVSYGTDSAYNECFGYNETRIRPLPHVDASGTAWTWNMYETNGVTTYATADKDAVIRQLLDFMFSPPIQNLTYEHLYMAPVNTRSLTLPACFAKGDPLLPNEASWLNTILYDHGSQEAKLTQYFSTWKTEWYALWQSTRNSARSNTARFSTCTASDVQLQFTGQTVSSASARLASMGSVVSLVLAAIVAIAGTVAVLA